MEMGVGATLWVFGTFYGQKSLSCAHNMKPVPANDLFSDEQPKLFRKLGD